MSCYHVVLSCYTKKTSVRYISVQTSRNSVNKKFMSCHLVVIIHVVTVTCLVLGREMSYKGGLSFFFKRRGGNIYSGVQAAPLSELRQGLGVRVKDFNTK
jgi:hypothetical protein